MVGRTISHYEIVEKLGEGGMGVVYKAHDTHLDRFVPIKVLPPEKVADAERKRRFVQEAKSASALNHPNIITIHDIASDNGLDFIAMEYVPGKPLNQLIARKGLPLAEALKYAVQIADALAAAHAAGIIHRDLKPANVMVSGAPERSGFVKVLDFGLAKLTDKADSGDREFTQSVQQDDTPASGEGSIVGTVSYMSPEQAEGKKVDARSDIFSFGSLLYEMVTTGRRAFQGESRLSTLSAVLREEPKPASQIVEGCRVSWSASSHAACANVKGREPAGYLESLKQKEPEVIFDPSKLHTKEDWIQAGKLVFESETLFSPAPESQPSAGVDRTTRLLRNRPTIHPPMWLILRAINLIFPFLLCKLQWPCARLPHPNMVMSTGSQTISGSHQFSL